MKNPLLFLLLGAIAAVNLQAQVAGGMGGTTPTISNGAQGSVQASPGTLSRPNEIAGSVYISGKVVMQDGSPVPQNVTIQRVCSGLAKTVAYTNANGRFSFKWGDGDMVVADASDAGSSPNRSSTGGFGSAQSAGGGNALATDPFGNRMMNCDVRASIAGFTSDSVSLVNRRNADSPDIGMIVLRRLAGVEGSSVSVTSMLAPKDAKKAYEHGLDALLKNKPNDAAKDFEKAVAIYPKYAEAWMNLGKLRLQQQSIEPARAALTKAMESDPKLITPYLELGMLAATDAKWKESADFLDQAVKLDPVDFPQAWYADAVAYYNLKNYDAAEKSAREAVKLDPKHVNPRAGYLLGLALAEKKDYAGAAAELGAYIKLAPDAPDLAQVKDQLAQIEKLNVTKQASAARP
jgi:tetratricopeptide (TPR) repeat protein